MPDLQKSYLLLASAVFTSKGRVLYNEAPKDMQEMQKDKMKSQFCCERFRESVVEGKIERSEDPNDETEWYFPEWLHIYYCPFCGTPVKSEGFGAY
jgi:hypothetical protein